MTLEEFVVLCAENGLKLNERQVNQYKSYADLLIEWNQKMNLTAIDDFEGILEKHFYDSLLPSFAHKIDGSLCDVGSGAGFPSIPLKIAYPELKITLVEPLAKRCTFLNEVVHQLGIDANICNERAEDFAKDYRESFDFVTARGVANLRVLSELCIPLVKLNGYFLAMKGMQGLVEDQEAQKALKTLGVVLEDGHKCELPDGSVRYNLYYKKFKNTDKKYPRAYAKIKKNPL